MHNTKGVIKHRPFPCFKQNGNEKKQNYKNTVYQYCVHYSLLGFGFAFGYIVLFPKQLDIYIILAENRRIYNEYSAVHNFNQDQKS